MKFMQKKYISNDKFLARFCIIIFVSCVLCLGMMRALIRHTRARAASLITSCRSWSSSSRFCSRTSRHSSRSSRSDAWRARACTDSGRALRATPRQGGELIDESGVEICENFKIFRSRTLAYVYRSIALDELYQMT